MSVIFHANQYENAYFPKNNRSWQIQKTSKFPKSRTGFTQPIVNERGHLLKEFPRNVIPSHHRFVSTWNLSCSIPGIITAPTNRSKESIERIKKSLVGWETDLKSQWLHEKKYNRLFRHYEGVPIKKDKIKLPDYMKAVTYGDPYFWELQNGMKFQRNQLLPFNIAPNVYLYHGDSRRLLSKATRPCHRERLIYPWEFHCVEKC